MPDINCKTCGGLGWVASRAAGCPECAPPLEKPKRKLKRSKGVNKESAKKKKNKRTHQDIRRLAKREIGYCDLCGEKREVYELEEHHIGRNRHNETANMRRCLYVCAFWIKDCHEVVDGFTVEQQCQVMADAALRAVKRCKRVN